MRLPWKGGDSQTVAPDGIGYIVKQLAFIKLSRGYPFTFAPKRKAVKARLNQRLLVTVFLVIEDKMENNANQQAAIQI